LADAWFGCKENIACCLDQNLVGIFQMKRGLLAWIFGDFSGWVGAEREKAFRVKAVGTV
jgi:hypothetical protein